MSQTTQAASASKSKFSVRDICYAGLFAAVIAVMAQISIPMPLGVPMTRQTFAISFPLMAYIIGLGVEHRNAFKGAFVTAVVVGTLVNYVVGVALFVVVAHSTIAVGISACVLPFIPTAIIKAVLACAIGLNLRKRIPGLKA